MKSTAVAVGLVATLVSSASAQDHGPPFQSVGGAFFGLSVPAMEASIRWYSEKLGLSLTFRLPGIPEVAVLEGGGLVVELVHDPAAGPRVGRPDLVHGPFKVGFIVNDFASTLSELRNRGVEVAFGPFPPSEQQRANVIIRDNSGNLIQIFGEGSPMPLRPSTWGRVKARWR
jgi:catechol 2,3-dioxygenase-like lactoylglutathione lyase family enzyme